MSTDSANQGGIIPLRPLGGDGDGDGDCQPVERDLITRFDFSSEGERQAIGVNQPWPTIGQGWVDIEAPTLNKLGGHTQAIGTASLLASDDDDIQQSFEATYNMCTEKIQTNPSVLALRLRAVYPGAPPVFLGPDNNAWCFSVGGSIPDEFAPPSFTVRVPAWPDIMGATGNPVLTWQAMRVANSNSLITIRGATWYLKQLFPQVTVSSVINCEDGTTPACLIPSQATIVDPSGGMGPAPVVYPFPGEPGWQLRVTMAGTFDPADYTAEVLLDGVPIAEGAPPVFATISAEVAGPPGTQTVWVMDFTTPPAGNPPTTIALRVTQNANPECTWTALAMSVPDS